MASGILCFKSQVENTFFADLNRTQDSLAIFSLWFTGIHVDAKGSVNQWALCMHQPFYSIVFPTTFPTGRQRDKQIPVRNEAGSFHPNKIRDQNGHSAFHI